MAICFASMGSDPGKQDLEAAELKSEPRPSLDGAEALPADVGTRGRD